LTTIAHNELPAIKAVCKLMKLEGVEWHTVIGFGVYARFCVSLKF